MSNNANNRRQFLKTTGQIATAGAIMSAAAPKLYAAEDDVTQVALVGCGGRGTGAASNALKVQPQTKLVAMADVFEKKMENSYGNLEKRFAGTGRLEVSGDAKFLGFDAYKKAMDRLDPGDIVILTTPPAFRWMMFKYAIEKGLNVFMEKPVTVDGPTSKRMLELNAEAKAKNLKVGVGLMCRHCHARQELFERIQGGEIGDVTMLRAYRMAGPTGSADVPPKPEGMSDLMYQISKFHGFLWLSGGAVSDFLIHNIDESCWMKNDWPVEAKASGGRHYRGDSVDQNFDTYSMEYTFKDGTKLFVNGRTIPGCKTEFASYAHGSKGIAVISSASHSPAKSRIYKGHNMSKENLLWAYPQPEKNPYQLEWDDFLDAIRNDKPYNEVDRGVMASAVTSMGRMAAHTGQVITIDQFLNHDHEFAPDIEKLTMDSPSPVPADENGKYPIPYPGLVKDREYE